MQRVWTWLRTHWKTPTIIAAASLAFGVYQFAYATRPPALRVSDLTASSVGTSAVQTWNHDAAQQHPTEATAAHVQISLRNTGSAPVLVTRARVTLRAHEHLDNCVEVGDVVSVDYVVDVEVPRELDAADLPWVHEARDLRYRVATGDEQVEALGLTFSVADANPFADPAVVVAADIELFHDLSDDPVTVGTVRLTLPPDFTGTYVNLRDEPPGPGDPACNRRNAAKLETVAAVAPVGLEASSSEFDDLLAAHRAWVGGTPFTGTP